MAVKPLRQNLSKQLANRLQEEIEKANYQDGDLFMTEAEVAEKFNVSRTVAREAVGQLRAIGLLEGRQRKGLIVRRPDPVHLFSASLPSFAKSERDFAELGQLRYVLEVGAIELAVRNATPEQILRLRELGDQIREIVQVEHTSLEENQLDLAFHSLLLEMTGSKLIAGMQRVLVEFFHTTEEVTHHNTIVAERVSWEHVSLAAAVENRDVESARAILRVHLGNYIPKMDETGASTVAKKPVRRSGSRRSKT